MPGLDGPADRYQSSFSQPVKRGDPIGSHAKTGHGLTFQSRQPVALAGCGQAGIPCVTGKTLGQAD